MTDTGRDTEKLRKLVSLLPGENCGKCGFENCGEFAVALVEGNARPFDCRNSRPRVREICEVLGLEVPPEQEQRALGKHGGHGHHDHHKHGYGHGKHTGSHRHGEHHAEHH
jgi:Na+-translocating ferredoxin:NAD+ oxidoreductase RNF subunit RnfB